MRASLPSDGELLREIYRFLDRDALLAKHPGLTGPELQEFFRKVARLLPPSPAPLPKRSSDGVAVLYTDGGSRGNPGPAGYGFVLTDGSSGTLLERGGFIGRATNNEAEYAGLLAGLEAALESGAKGILVRSDSELLVKQLNGQYKVKSPRLVPLCIKARRLLERFESWRVEHVRREFNARADELANEAMDSGMQSAE